MDNEVKGEGNSLNYKFRMHDPRVGRFLSIDPLSTKYPYYSSYQFSGNRPIDMVELEGLEPASPRYLWSNTQGYKYLGDFYGNGNTISKVQGWWISSYIDNEGSEVLKFYDPNHGKNNGWRRFTPAKTRSLSADLEAIGKHPLKILYKNTDVNLTYTAQVGYGEADYVRILGVQLDKGIKATGSFKVLELNGLEALKAYYKSDEFSGITNTVHAFDKFDVSGEIKQSKGIYAGSISTAGILSDGELSLSGGASGSYSVFSLSGEGNINFDMEKFKYGGGDFNLDFSIEGFDISKESPAKFNNGMKLFNNLKLDVKFDLDQIYKDFRDLPVETPVRNQNLGPFIID